MLADIATTVFGDETHMQYWVTLLAVESKFSQNAKSHKNAIGIGQLLPKYRDSFAAPCGLDTVTESDIKDTYTNAYLSACYFNYLLEFNNGSIPLALISYNAGPYSKDLAKARNGVSMSNEPANYTTKVWLTREGKQ